MLSTEENEFLCRVGPGTPMGDLFRRYWNPFLLSSELRDPDGPPVRVKLLGEKLVAFRDTNGVVGLIGERCPHRGASLFFGINQECGLMCIYHGWKYDVDGNCVDMPSDLPGSTFKEKVHATAYPCWENNGVLWTYMGPTEKQPAYPDFIFNRLPPEHVSATCVPIYCNYLQSIEGNIDSTHTGTLHRAWADFEPVDDGTDKPGYPSGPMQTYIQARSRYAKVEVQDTDYGFRLIAIRPTDKGNQNVRIAAQVLPLTRVATRGGRIGGALIHVPMDDENCFRMDIQCRTDQPISAGERQAAKSGTNMEDDGKRRRNRADNDYNIDRWAQKNTFIAGIWPTADQDYAITESMGPIIDRTGEHLYAGDAAIIRYRQMLGKAARNLREGIEPPALDPSIPFHKIRSEHVIIGPDDDPWLVGADAGETAKRGERLR